MDIENTGLWQRSFLGQPHHTRKVDRLTVSLRKMRDNAAHLTTQIANDLPGLTMHDVTHLDALWHIADTLVADSFALNPLEAYVLGCAVLLHDTGLCFEAYAGGRAGLRDSVEWKDAYARVSHTHSTPTDARHAADFEALRALHGAQAGKLAREQWRDARGGSIYLIEDSDLRDNYGHLIGQIATSHSWDIAAAAATFAEPFPPAAFLPSHWHVNALLLACLLRAADAGHLDGARAPSFLLSLLRRDAVSLEHWLAQNRLGRVFVNPHDSSELVVASTAPFFETDARSWWVAFDAIAQFDRELRACNATLAHASSDARLFARKRVAGAGSPVDLSRHVRTQGWQPTNAEVRVTDVARLIGTLGGAELYGVHDRLQIVLRELVQNASDAIDARYTFATDFLGGYITIRLINTERGYVLRVDDNGVGMSAYTLTSELLDFGRSFWRTARASSEFPGLQSGGFQPVGRFGIGFFSVFMVASSAKVFSRRFDSGLDSVRCLSFSDGLSLRPTLSNSKPSDLGMNCSTRVEVCLNRDAIPDPDRINIRADIQGHDGFCVCFEDYVGAITGGVTNPVFVDRGRTVEVHPGFPPPTERMGDWLQTMAYAKSGTNNRGRAVIAESRDRLRMLRHGGKCFGLAALSAVGSNRCEFATAKAVGGLVEPHNRYSGAFIGLIDHLPNNAKREPGDIAAPREAVEDWLQQQVTLLQRRGLDFSHAIWASYSLRTFDGDPMELLPGIMVRTNAGDRSVSFAGLIALLESGTRLGFRVSSMGNHLDGYDLPDHIPGWATCIVMDTGRFNESRLAGNGPSDPKSLIGVVHRNFVRRGKVPKWHVHPKFYRSMFGRGDCLEVTVEGS